MSFSAAPVGYTAALAQVQAIQSQIASIGTAFSGATSASGGASVSGSAATSPGAASATVGSSFASQLQSALTDSGATSDATELGDSDVYGATSGTTALTGSDLYGSLLAGTAAPTGMTVALPTNASSMLTSGQQQFASRLASDTGLDTGVVSAWLLAEESGSAATSRQSQNNNDWLNIGYTDSGTYGSADSVWSNPTTAADATAGWLKGQDTIPGYGTASSGIQSILTTAGQAPATQIQALQDSGWSSSGYPDLDSLYGQVAG